MSRQCIVTLDLPGDKTHIAYVSKERKDAIDAIASIAAACFGTYAPQLLVGDVYAPVLGKKPRISIHMSIKESRQP